MGFFRAIPTLWVSVRPCADHVVRTACGSQSIWHSESVACRLIANSECLRGASIGFVSHKTAGTAGRSGQTGGKAVGTGSPGDIQKVHITKRGKRGNNIVVPLYVGYCKGLVSGSSFAVGISTVFFSLVCTKPV